MSMADLEEGLKLIADADDKMVSGPKTTDEIEAAETALGLKFPPTYRRFLAECGSGGAGGEEFYGLTRNPDFVNSSVPNAIWLTLKHRQKYSLPAELVLVYALGDGTLYAVDTSQGGALGESPVIEWPSGPPPERRRVVSSDFGIFLRNRIASALAVDDDIDDDL